MKGTNDAPESLFDLSTRWESSSVLLWTRRRSSVCIGSVHSLILDLYPLELQGLSIAFVAHPDYDDL
jgi:hypothetical protein